MPVDRQLVEPVSSTASDLLPAVSLSGIAKLYGTFAALRHVTLTLPPGSCTMLLGENGAGKSTLLRLIAGLLAPSRGTLEVLGGTPLSMRGRIAYMSHAPMLYDELTGVENLQYFASLERTSGSCTVCTGSVHAALQAVGLDPKLERTVGQYSQGMRQRVSLARALQTDPDLLLLDEPFSNLDVASTQQMIDLLAGFRTWAPSNAGAEPGRQVAARTLLLTTHQAHLAESLADTIVTMRGGTIMAVERRA